MKHVLGVLGLTLLWLAIGCKQTIPELPRNHCSRDGDCSGPSYCDELREICVADRAQRSYVVALQVAHKNPATGKVRRHTFDPFPLKKSDPSVDLNIPPGRTLGGFVGTSAMDGKKAVRAELTFMPMSDHEGAPVAPVIATSRDAVSSQDQTNLRVTLASGTRYDVTAVPLGEASARLPPAHFSLETSESESFNFVFPPVETFRGLVVDEMNTPLRDLWVRVIDAKTREVLSSIGVVDRDGKLELFVNPGVLDGGLYRFEVNLDREHAWETVIEVDPSRVDAAKSNALILPVVPRFVRFRGTVEKSADVRLSSADLTFVSDFPVPNVPGEVGNRDFCRSTMPGDERPPFLCHSVRRGTTDDNGRFEVALLPGDYRVFLSPATDGENVDRATTLAGEAVIETQAADRPQQGQVYMLETGSSYTGTVRSEGGVIENVLVRAVALGVVGTLREVAAYNRTSETLTDEKGVFTLAVDLGYYDLVARPAETSGYPWLYVPYQIVNVENTQRDVGGFALPTPVLVAGKLKDDGQVAAFATVDAFALLPGEGGRRAVPIARTTTDAEGNYTLLLAPRIPPLDAPSQVLDSGAE